MDAKSNWNKFRERPTRRRRELQRIRVRRVSTRSRSSKRRFLNPSNVDGKSTFTIHALVRPTKQKTQLSDRHALHSLSNSSPVLHRDEQQTGKSQSWLEQSTIVINAIPDAQTPSNQWDNDQSSQINKDSSSSNRITTDKRSHSLITKIPVKSQQPPVPFQTTHRKRISKAQKRRRNFCHCCPFSLPCLILSILFGLLLAVGIAAIVVGVITTPKTTGSSSITTTITSTVAPISCNTLCPGATLTFSPDLLTRWTFDGSLADATNTYPATTSSNVSFVSNGYVNQALFLQSTLNQSLAAPYIPLTDTSFTAEVWIKPTLLVNVEDHGLLGLCSSLAPDQCLSLTLRRNGSNFYLYFGFFLNDCSGTTALSLNQWAHAAFVFDIATMTQSIYLNGQLDCSRTASGALMVNQTDVTIGGIPLLIPYTNLNYYAGYMDQLSITGRAKSACEVLEDATLAACFLFDNANPYGDSGPNGLSSSEMSTTIVSPGQVGQAISFNGSSFFQASSFTGLGLATQPFSILLWIRPRSTNRTLVYVSGNSNGLVWCIPFVGIASNGTIVVQEYTGTSSLPCVISTSTASSTSWTHIAETWSATNGLRLYINGVLIGTLSSATTYAASGVSNYVTLGNSLSGMNTCFGGCLGSESPGAFNGDIDDFRVYSRELTAAEVSTIEHG